MKVDFSITMRLPNTSIMMQYIHDHSSGYRYKFVQYIDYPAFMQMESKF